MKKGIGFVMLLFFLWWSVHAKEIIQPLNLQKVSDNQITTIWLQFCTEWENYEHLFLNIAPGEKKSLCIKATANGEKDQKILVWFTAWFRNANGNIICDADMTNNIIAHSIHASWKYIPLLLPAKGEIIKKATVQFPSSASGVYYGCMAGILSQQDQNPKGKNMFTTVLRKVAPMTIVVSSQKKTFQRVKNFWYDIKMYQDVVYRIIIFASAGLFIRSLNAVKK